MNGIVRKTVLLAALLGTTLTLVGRGEEPKLAPQSSAPTPTEIETWIKALDDPRYREREEATQHLLSAGTTGLEALLAAANGNRPEPADRAVWIMRRLGRSRDDEVATAALEHLAQLVDRPALVSKAEAELTERGVTACEQRLAPLGAEIDLQVEPIDIANVAPFLVVRFGEKWRGTVDDLRQVAQLRGQQHFHLQGAPINDEVVKLFADRDKLAYLRLFDTKVSPAAVDAIKKKHPDAVIYIRGPAMLGVQAENHAGGVRVTFVQAGSAAAAAGILVGDIIASIDGHALPDFDRLTARIGQHQPGDKVDVEIVRNDARIKLTPVLGTRTDSE